MMEQVKSGNLADRLQELIGVGRVVAALFSTFIFRREFFERTVLPLVVGESQEWRGKIPVTVIADRNSYQGHGWGYDVILPPAVRTWHAKLILLLLREEDKCWTVLGIGSGNLTRSGWEGNQELPRPQDRPLVCPFGDPPVAEGALAKGKCFREGCRGNTGEGNQKPSGSSDLKPPLANMGPARLRQLRLALEPGSCGFPIQQHRRR